MFANLSQEEMKKILNQDDIFDNIIPFFENSWNNKEVSSETNGVQKEEINYIKKEFLPYINKKTDKIKLYELKLYQLHDLEILRCNSCFFIIKNNIIIKFFGVYEMYKVSLCPEMNMAVILGMHEVFIINKDGDIFKDSI